VSLSGSVSSESFVPLTTTCVTEAVTISVTSSSVTIIVPVAVSVVSVSFNSAVSAPFVITGASFVPVINTVTVFVAVPPWPSCTVTLNVSIFVSLFAKYCIFASATVYIQFITPLSVFSPSTTLAVNEPNVLDDEFTFTLWVSLKSTSVKSIVPKSVKAVVVEASNIFAFIDTNPSNSFISIPSTT